MSLCDFLLLIVLFHVNNRQVHSVEDRPQIPRLKDHNLALVAAHDETVLGQPAATGVDGGIEFIVTKLAPGVILTAETSQNAIAYQRHLVGI